jgi:hypothetical protein
MVNMTIQWKALKEHFPMVPLVFKMVEMTTQWKALKEDYLTVDQFVVQA